MREYEALEDLDMVSQGDVIEWVDSERKRPWHVYGIVVTADCDLALEKHGGVISYVPAMVTEDFIWERWRIERFTGDLDDWLSKCAVRISKWMAKTRSESAITKEAMRVWLERVGDEGVLDEAGVKEKGERSNLLNVLQPANVLLKLIQTEKPNLKMLLDAYNIVKPTCKGDYAMLAVEVQRSWAGLPGDLFHLPTMPDEDAGAGHGLFLHLRHIRQVPGSELSARPDDLRSGKAKARRVARVSAPYRYAITQALARVFSDIGLPDAYDVRRKAAAQSFLNGEVFE